VLDESYVNGTWLRASHILEARSIYILTDDENGLGVFEALEFLRRESTGKGRILRTPSRVLLAVLWKGIACIRSLNRESQRKAGGANLGEDSQ